MEQKFHFDALARTWDTQSPTVERSEVVFAWMRDRLHLDNAMACLELGAATGRLGFLLAPLVSSVHLADGSAEMVAVVQERLAKSPGEQGSLSTAVLDLDKDTLPPGPWDLVYSVMTLHHVIDPPGLFRRIAAVTRPGAQLCLVDLESEDGSFHHHMPDARVHHGFDTRALARDLAMAGLTVTSTDRIHTLRKPGPDGINRTYPLFMVCARKD